MTKKQQRRVRETFSNNGRNYVVVSWKIWKQRFIRKESGHNGLNVPDMPNKIRTGINS